MDYQDAPAIIEEGGIAVIPTDTLYGLVGSAFLPDTVDRIYELKRRDPKKPLIVLIGDVEELERFGVEVSHSLIERLATYWPGPVSLVLPTMDDQFEYLSRGTDTIAFRLPDHGALRELLREVGPLVAPSANMEGQPPATTVAEARRMFGTDVDCYVDGGVCSGPASTLFALHGDEAELLRGE